MLLSSAYLILVLAVQCSFTIHVQTSKLEKWSVKITCYGQPVCSGTLISNRFFATLADCIDQSKLEEYQVIIGGATLRAVSHILESPEGDDVIVGILSSTVKVSKRNIARIPVIGNDQKVEKAGEDGRDNYVSGIDVNGATLVEWTSVLEDDECAVDFDDEINICVSDEGFCSLLPGAAVVANVNRRLTLTGLIPALSLSAERCNRPITVLNIARHQPWLNRVTSLKAGSVCGSIDDCGENMICVQNMCVCNYCHEPDDGECIESNRKILVLGAGMAGITAAKTLEENGCRNFQILEGSSRIGGRVKAVEMSGYTLEVGAQWIYGLGTNPIAALAAKYGLSYTEDPDTWTVRDKSGNDLTDQADEDWEKLDKALNKLEKFAKNMRKNDIPDITAEGLLRRFGWAPDNNVAETIEVYGRDLESGKETPSCSGKYLNHLNAFEEHGSDYWPILSDPRGYSFIIEEMSKTFLSENDPRLDLNTTVTRIEDWDEDDERVKVFTEDGGMYEADSVIVTFSIGVLQSRRVSFVPSLPVRKMIAIDKLGIGQYIMMYFKFANAFWDNTSTILYAADRHGEDASWYNMNVVFPGCNILQLALSGFEAEAVDRMEDTEIIRRGMATLEAMYPGVNITGPEDFATFRWTSDPLTMGAYSYWTTGFTPEDMDDLSMPEENLYFAGEHLSKKSYGFVHSAYNSGMKTAQKLVKRVV